MSHSDSNLYTHFRQEFDRHPQNELLRTDNDLSFSCADIDRRAAQCARFLTDLGAKPGDRISVQADKSVECFCLYLASLRGGFVFHPLNPAYTTSELEYFLGNAEPSIVVCDPDKEASISTIAKQAGAREVLTMNAFGAGTFASGANGAESSFETVPRGPDDLAALLYSSGTTGLPKGIMLTHSNLLSNTVALVKAWGFTDKDRLLHALPIFHVHGLFVAVGCVLLGGASMRWLTIYDANQVISFIPECTVMMGVPTYYTRLLANQSFNAQVTNNMRLFVSGSAPLLKETFGEFEQRTGHRILERYGMTETNMNTSNPLNGERKAETVGLPLPGVDVRIVDDNGHSIKDGEIGNLQVRGPNVFIGYWKMPDKTTEDFTEDGFFNTGDKGCVDEDGYISIVGRAKDVVITGGLNVYPKEIELFVDDIPGVKESAVIGVPHLDFGEAVVAVVVKETDDNLIEADMISACREELANFKVPKRIVFLDELPRNTMAKVQKNVLREKYHDLLS